MVYCAVYGCKSSNKSSEKIIFHRFPKNTAEAAKWLQFCRRADNVNLKNAAVCGLHFRPSDYRRNLLHEELNPGQPDSRPRLKHGAVPTVALPNCNIDGNDARIRKKYLHENSYSVQLQHEGKRCEEFGVAYENTSVSDSPVVLQNVKLEKSGCNEMFSTLKEKNFNQLERNTFHNNFSKEPKRVDLISYDCPAVCLMCDAVIKDSLNVGVLDLYSEFSLTTHTQQRVVVMLAVLIDTPLHSDEAYSKSLCQRCYSHLDELDEVQHRASVIKSNIKNIYNQTLQRRNFVPLHIHNEELQDPSSLKVFKTGEETSVEVFSSSQVETEIPKVIRIAHSTGTVDPTTNEKEIPSGGPKPIIIKVYKTSPQVNPVSEGMVIQNKHNIQTKRKQRKSSEIVHLCKFCRKIFLTGEELKKHQKTHTLIECKFCGKILVRIGAWENHLKMFHSADIQNNKDCVGERFTCDKCGKRFTSKPAIRYHMKLHEGRTYSCEKCNKVFNHPGSLRNHQRVHEEKKYICEKCGKRFHTNFLLIMHDNQTHRKARSWKCKFCGKAFARCATYREHLHHHCTKKITENFTNPHDKPELTGEDNCPNVNDLISDNNIINEKEELLFNDGCKMLSIEEVCTNEEAVVINEGESTCDKHLSDPQPELYDEEFVMSSDGNLIIDNLMDVR